MTKILFETFNVPDNSKYVLKIEFDCHPGAKGQDTVVYCHLKRELYTKENAE